MSNRYSCQYSWPFYDRWIAVLRRYGLDLANSRAERLTLSDIYKRRRSMSRIFLLVAMVGVAFASSPKVATAQTFVEFDAPNSGTTGYLGTIPTTINSLGAITGYTQDADSVTRGFVRSFSGELVNFVPRTGAQTPRRAA